MGDPEDLEAPLPLAPLPQGSELRRKSLRIPPAIRPPVGIAQHPLPRGFRPLHPRHARAVLGPGLLAVEAAPSLHRPELPLVAKEALLQVLLRLELPRQTPRLDGPDHMHSGARIPGLPTLSRLGTAQDLSRIRRAVRVVRPRRTGERGEDGECEKPAAAKDHGGSPWDRPSDEATASHHALFQPAFRPYPALVSGACHPPLGSAVTSRPPRPF